MGIKVFDARDLSLASILDEKLKNYYISETNGNYIIETIVQYLARVTFEHRFPATAVAVLLPKAGYTPVVYSYATTEDFSLGLNNFDDKLYAFIGGLEDIHFVEIKRYGEADKLLSGGEVSWLEGFTYSVAEAEYSRYGNEVPIMGGQVTLAASDLTYNRIDLVVINMDTNTFSSITGTPALNPIKPQINNLTQIELTEILIPAGATSGSESGITNNIVYDENTEWTVSSVGVTVDANNLVSPLHGTKCISTGAIGMNDTISFTSGAPINVADFSTLLIHIQLQALANPSNSMIAQFLLAGVPVSNTPYLSFSRSNLAWQSIVKPFADFTFSSATFDQLRLTWIKTGPEIDFTGIKLDYIRLQNGVELPTFNDTVKLTGDVTASGQLGSDIPATLATVNPNAGTFGSTTKIPVIIVDGKGRVIGVTEETIAANITKQVTGITLLSTSWTLVTGLYEYDLANVNITATSIVDVIPENASIAIVKAADVLPKTISSAGSVKLYSTNAPTGDISVTINITEATV